MVLPKPLCPYRQARGRQGLQGTENQYSNSHVHHTHEDGTDCEGAHRGTVSRRPALTVFSRARQAFNCMAGSMLARKAVVTPECSTTAISIFLSAKSLFFFFLCKFAML